MVEFGQVSIEFSQVSIEFEQISVEFGQAIVGIGQVRRIWADFFWNLDRSHVVIWAARI